MLVLQKYGGSSVADLDRIRACADRCVRTAKAGNDLVVVVSAMKGETNRLIALANALVEHAPQEADRGPYVTAARRSPEHDRELDQLVATGEKVSAEAPGAKRSAVNRTTREMTHLPPEGALEDS